MITKQKIRVNCLGQKQTHRVSNSTKCYRIQQTETVSTIKPIFLVAEEYITLKTEIRAKTETRNLL